MNRAYHLPNLTFRHSDRLWQGLCGLLLWLACSAQATFYWDLNGATAGAGGPSPTGTWDTASLNWNATASGASATQVWGDNNEAVFSAGTDASGPFTVTVTGTRYCKNLFVEEGAVKFNTGTVFMVSTNPPTTLPIVAVASGASASFAGSGSGYIGGTNGLNKTGGGSLDMGSSETYTGNTSIDGGTCFVRSITTTANPFGNSGGSATVFLNNGSAVLANAVSSGTGNTVILRSGYTLSLSSGGGNLGALSGYVFQVEGNITGTGSLTVNQPGLLVLHGAGSDFSGGTTISEGSVVQFQVNGALGNASSTVTLNGGCLKNDGTSTALGSARVVTLGANHGYLDAGWGDGPGGAADLPLTISSKISGGGQLRINLDSSPVVLANGGNDYAGDTVIGLNGPGYYASGVSAWLQLGASEAIPHGPGKGNVIIDNAYKGLLDLAGRSETINGLAGNGTVDNVAAGGSSTLTVGGNDQTSAFDGVIKNTSGTVGLTKIGEGSLALGGASTYSGATVASGGTLVVNGSIGSGAVSVQTNATLGGGGTIGGTVTVQSGGTLSPGSAVGEVTGGPSGGADTLLGKLIAPVQAATVFYVNEQGDLFGVPRPGITEPVSALALLGAPPPLAEVGQTLTSGVPAGTKVLGVTVKGEATLVDFSEEIIACKLDDARLELIFNQVRTTLAQFGLSGSVRLQSQGRLLSEFLPALPRVAAAPKDLSAAPKASTGALAGKKISLSPGHGRYWHGDAWYYDRGVYCAPLNREDDHNLEGMKYLDTFLAQDGATTKQYRCFDKNYGTHSSGAAWWQMSASYWLKQAGYPCSVYANATGDCNLGTGATEYSDTVRSRPLAADYDNTDAHVSLHSNGLSGDCTGSGCPNGTCTYYEGTSTEHLPWATVSRNLAISVQNAMVSAIRTKYTDASWRDRGALDAAGAFAETRMPDRAAILIELAFHDTCDRDGLYLQDNFFRSTTMWGVYKGICDYFGVTPTWDYYSYEVVSDTLPSALSPGQTVTAQITVRNRGVLWNDAEQFSLGAVGDSDPFSTTTRYGVGGEVDTGVIRTFSLTLTAPLTPGTYTTDWRMLREMVTWFGPTVSKTITVAGSAPIVTTQPQGQTVVAGGSATFSVVPGGLAPFAYQWRFNGTNIAGATQSTFTLNNVQSTNAGSYSAVVTNTYGAAISSNAVLAVITVPVITTQPQNQTAVVGSSASFSVVAVGPLPLSYQWRWNGTNLAGATQSAFPLNNVQTNNAGSYSVVVTNQYGSVPSGSALLTVVMGPQIAVQPQGQTVNAGGTAAFSVTATGPAPLSYQWRRNGENIAGATASSYTRSNVQASDVGLFSVVVSNPYGTATSGEVALSLGLVGKLTVGGMTWNGGGSYDWEMMDASGVAGTGYDTVDASAGTLAIAASAGDKFKLKLMTLSGDSSGPAASFNNNSSYAWTIASAAAVSGFAADKFILDDSQFLNDLAGGALSVEQSPLKLRFTPNHPPVANPTNYYRLRGTALAINLPELLAARTSDADGDGRVLQLLKSASGLMKSARGHTLSTNSTTIIYTNISDNVADSFDYVVLDSRSYRTGDTKRYATNTVSIIVAEPFTPMTVTQSGGGGLTLGFYGIPGYQYVMQRSSNLVDWVDVVTNTAPEGGPNAGLIEFAEVPPHTPAFYRARMP